MKKDKRKEAIKVAEHYYTKDQNSLFTPTKIKVRLQGRVFELYTAGGVFSPKKLDKGTKLLIETAVVKDGWKVLDLGCGYGVLGIALKRQHPSIELVMSDVNSRAVKLAKMNIKLHRLEADVMQSNVYSNKRLAGMKFDTILLNPPQTAGKKVCFRMIEESREHLKKGGLLQTVARHQKGGKHLSQKMEEVFGNVQESGKGAGYRIYISEKHK